jgi:hypothetical protein
VPFVRCPSAPTGGPTAFCSIPSHTRSVSVSFSPPVTPPTLAVVVAQVLLPCSTSPTRTISAATILCTSQSSATATISLHDFRCPQPTPFSLLPQFLFFPSAPITLYDFNTDKNQCVRVRYSSTSSSCLEIWFMVLLAKFVSSWCVFLQSRKDVKGSLFVIKRFISLSFSPCQSSIFQCL